MAELPSKRPAWAALQSHYASVKGTHLRDLFAGDSGRGTKMTAEAVGIYLDYSKNRATEETLKLLFALAEQDEKWKWAAPSPTGLGLGILLPFSAVATIFVGAVIGAIWMVVARRSASVYLVPLASGFIAGEALIAVLVPVLLAAGIGGG